MEILSNDRQRIIRYELENNGTILIQQLWAADPGGRMWGASRLAVKWPYLGGTAAP